jgi:hypothetical protein
MTFLNSYITNVGQDLLTAAASGEKITWIRAATSSWDVDDKPASDMKSLTTIVQNSSQYTGSGNVSSYIVNDNTKTASINCQIDNNTYQSGGLANLFGVWAKTDATYPSEQLVFVARRGGGSQTSISSKSVDPEYKLFVKFGIRVDNFENPANVTLTIMDDVYATAEELNDETVAREDFDARSVTTHSAANALSGDPQDVYGEKTFKNDTKHSGNILPTANTLNIGSDTTNGKWNTVYATSFSGTAEGAKNIRYINDDDLSVTDLLSAESEDQITLYSNIIPSSDDNFTLGDTNNKWSDVYTHQITFDGYKTSSSGSSAASLYTISESGTDYDYSLNGICVVGNIHPFSDNNYSFGNKTHRWKSIYSNAVHALGDSKDRGLILCDGNYEHRAYCSITGYQDSDDGRMTMHFVNATDNLEYKVVWKGPNTSTSGSETLTTIPQSNSTWSLGDNTHRLKEVYATTLYGNLSNKVTINNNLYSSTMSLVNPEGTMLLWSFDSAIAPTTDYGKSIGYYSSAADKSRRWNYVYAKYLGSSNSHINTAYIDSIYVGSSTLTDYIKNTTVNSASNASAVTINTSSNGSTNYQLVFAVANSGTNSSLFIDSDSSSLKYNPSTNVLSNFVPPLQINDGANEPPLGSIVLLQLSWYYTDPSYTSGSFSISSGGTTNYYRNSSGPGYTMYSGSYIYDTNETRYWGSSSDSDIFNMYFVAANGSNTGAPSYYRLLINRGIMKITSSGITIEPGSIIRSGKYRVIWAFNSTSNCIIAVRCT